MRYPWSKVPLNVRRFVHILLRPSFLLASSSFSPGPWLVHVELLVAVDYLIVGPGLPLLQAIGRYEISLTRNDLASWLAQRAARTYLFRSGSFLLLLFFLPEDGWIEWYIEFLRWCGYTLYFSFDLVDIVLESLATGFRSFAVFDWC